MKQLLQLRNKAEGERWILLYSSYLMMSNRELYLWISCIRTTFRGDGSSWSMELGFLSSIKGGIIPRMSANSPNT